VIRGRIRGDEALERRLIAVRNRGGNLQTPMKRFGRHMTINSIPRNFAAGGRPDRWEPSKRVQVRGGKTLVDRGLLQNATRAVPSKRGLKLINNRPGARALQEGHSGFTVTPKTARALRFRLPSGQVVFAKRAEIGPMPPRPFILFQRRDREIVLDHIDDHLLEK
jgi:phage gpG-like protein